MGNRSAIFVCKIEYENTVTYTSLTVAVSLGWDLATVMHILQTFVCVVLFVI
jgi:hypothetical protein